MQTRMVLFIVLGVYLLAVGFILSAVTIDIPVSFDSSENAIPMTDYVWALPYNISILPIWFNTIFILVPFIAWLVILVTLFFPTGNAGS